MDYAPLLFNQLAELTAMRDIELMEFSLLRTLKDFLNPAGLSILKIDGKGQPYRELAFNNSQCVVTADEIKVPGELVIAIAGILGSGDATRSTRTGDGLTEIFHIHKTRSTQAFLIITVKEPLSRMNAYLVGGMLQIYRNFCEVLRDGQTDQLTGLYNRKTFDDSINKVFSLLPDEADGEFPGDKRDRKSVGYWLVMVDIDHFKAVNDKFGHLYGDEVLILLAQTMQACFRDEDMLFRFGGEEFVFVLRGTDQAGCAIALERFRTAVEERDFPQVGRVTVSIGACRMTRDTYSVTLIDYADKAMYHSKKTGRNRTTFFEDLVASGAEKYEEVATGDITLF
ncbi:MAG: hypothetical protein CVV47_08495 [Spirochaetae bacterium HGW-Spirochaetae-3]|jgi:diguanylate cyclase (GGDEF)-like protein|nr:MAG: hypothetical protein CVV47_08495 [Spirochaetae bacterium HGW-Spirochaetae-3]